MLTMCVCVSMPSAYVGILSFVCVYVCEALFNYICGVPNPGVHYTSLSVVPCGHSIVIMPH